MNTLKKYKWYLIGYAIYITLMPWYLKETVYRYSSSGYGFGVLFWCVGAPLILYVLYRLYKYIFGNKKDYNGNEVKIQAVETDLQSSIPLMDFAKTHGRMQILLHTDIATGNRYIQKCLFTNGEGKETYTWVAKYIRDYTALDISNNKDKLMVTILPSGDYCLCLAWEDVNL